MGDLPHSVWNGSLRLRDLVVPVRLAPTLRNGDPRFRLIHRDCGQLVENARTCPEHGKVADEELVKGWEIAKGEYLPVEPDELEQVAPADTRVVDVYAIVAADSIDPLLVRRAYYLMPAESAAGREGYAALGHALQTEELAGVARFTAWGQEHLAAIAPHRYVLVLWELAPHTDLRDQAAIADAAATVELDENVCELARKLVARLEVPFEPGLLASLYRGRLQQLLDARLVGSNLIQAPPVAQPGPAVTTNIAGALEQSLRGIPRSRRARVEQALAHR